MEDARTPVSAKKSKVSMWRSPSDKSRSNKRLSIHSYEVTGLDPASDVQADSLSLSFIFSVSWGTFKTELIGDLQVSVIYLLDILFT